MKTIASTLVVALLLNNAAVMADGKPGSKTATKAKTTAKAKAATTLKVDPAKSEVNWTGEKVTGKHSGNIKIAKGILTVDGNKLTGGSFDIDMKSIVNTDLTDAGYNAKLVGHLKNDDFFGVEKYPTSTFKITKVEPIAGAKAGDPNYTVTGDLTIKGITNPVTFPATVTITGNKAEATAKVTVDRTKYGIKYNSKNFFESIGDKAIYDDFILDLKVVAAK